MNRIILTMFIIPIMSLHCIADDPAFTSVLIDDNLPGAYQVSVADINNDGKPDIAALSNNVVRWYENPSWKPRPICDGQSEKNIDLAFYDIDDDGELEMALAYNFDLGDSSIGDIAWLDRNGNLDKPWTIHHIHTEATAHRLRLANLDNEGKPEMVVVPIIGPGSNAPQFDQSPFRLLAFFIPNDPVNEKWRMEVIDDTLKIGHGTFIQHRDNGETDMVLTASLEGVHQYQRDHGRWSKQKITSGAPDTDERPGSSEIAVGNVNGERFYATIDPWHGNQVAVYQSGTDGETTRNVIDDTFIDGHALACANFDEDVDDEIIAGYRGEGYSIYLYDHTPEGWKRTLIDNEVAAQGFFVADINGDGKLDFAAGGGRTRNVKLYLQK